jgi:hypothetical protein
MDTGIRDVSARAVKPLEYPIRTSWPWCHYCIREDLCVLATG